MSKIKALIVKISGNMCNLRCKYCFYCKTDQQKRTIMPENLLEKTIKQFLKLNNQRASFIWHGGEPLMCGIDYFKKIIEYQKKYKLPGQKIRNSLQTNGILINEEWIDFFKKNNFGLGISIDGDKTAHDCQRVFPGGKGSFYHVVDAIKLMQSKQFKFGAIQVLTKENLERCGEIFNFFAKEIKLQKWAINQMCYIQDDGKISDDSITEEEYYAYIKETFDLWLEYDKKYLSIREIDNLLAGTYKVRPNNCNYNGTCGEYLCIDYNGDVYPCDRFSSGKEWLFGNILKDGLKNVYCSPKRQLFLTKIRKINSECFICEMKNFCNNGCPHHRIENLSGKYYYCLSRRNLYDYFNLTKACAG